MNLERIKRMQLEAQVERLASELKRTMLVQNHFAGAILDGFYPSRNLGGPVRESFKGTDRERLQQLFKIREVEVSRICAVLCELGLEHATYDYEIIWNELSKSAEITDKSHFGL